MFLLYNLFLCVTQRVGYTIQNNHFLKSRYDDGKEHFSRSHFKSELCIPFKHLINDYFHEIMFMISFSHDVLSLIWNGSFRASFFDLLAPFPLNGGRCQVCRLAGNQIFCQSKSPTYRLS